MNVVRAQRLRNREFAAKVIEWGRREVSTFPWRQTKDPYKILVAEILLRKTTRAQVVQVFAHFLKTFPNVESLSIARISAIRNLIRPLGLENVRASSLARLAKRIVNKHRGNVPTSRVQLLQLPGVGPYIANAVMCMAYGKDEPLVDTNSIRVIVRVFSVKSERSRPRDDPTLWKIASELLPAGRAREYNLSLLDLARSVCLPRRPKCFECPLLHLCDFGLKQTQLENSTGRFRKERCQNNQKS